MIANLLHIIGVPELHTSRKLLGWHIDSFYWGDRKLFIYYWGARVQYLSQFIAVLDLRCILWGLDLVELIPNL